MESTNMDDIALTAVKTEEDLESNEEEQLGVETVEETEEKDIGEEEEVNRDSRLSVVLSLLETGIHSTYNVTVGGIFNADMYPWLFVLLIAGLIGVVEFI